MYGWTDTLFGLPRMTVYIMAGTFIFTLLIIFLSRCYLKKLTGGDLKASGETAQATILRMWDTGTTVNQNPVAGFLLEVRRATYPPYQVETKSLVPRLMSGQLQPGTIVPIKVDPRNQQRVVLDIFG